MAMTPAEKMKRSRQRMKEEGGKELRLIMSHGGMICLAKLQEQNFPMPDMDVSLNIDISI